MFSQPNIKFIINMMWKYVWAREINIGLMGSFQGSTVDRRATDKEKSNACPTLKDIDFVESKRTIDLGSEQKKTFMERLKRDVKVIREEKQFH